jgi:hypothetical protein
MSGDYSKYHQLLEQARGSAKHWIPKLCQALREANSVISNEDIRKRVTRDCLSTWLRTTINNALPKEFKNKERSQTGKKGRQKQLEQANGTLTISEEPTISWAKKDSDSSTEQELQSLDRPSHREMVGQLQDQLNNTRQEQEEAKEAIAALTGRKNMDDVSDMNDERDNLLESDKVTRLSELNKKECAYFVDRAGKIIRRRIASSGMAIMRFSILTERKSSKTECLIPVKFRVDFTKKTTSLVLDERRMLI